MKRTGEAIGSYVGMAVGTLIGAAKTAPIVYVAPTGGIASILIGGMIGLLSGNKVGSEIDRRRH